MNSIPSSSSTTTSSSRTTTRLPMNSTIAEKNGQSHNNASEETVLFSKIYSLAEHLVSGINDKLRKEPKRVRKSSKSIIIGGSSSFTDDWKSNSRNYRNNKNEETKQLNDKAKKIHESASPDAWYNRAVQGLSTPHRSLVTPKNKQHSTVYDELYDEETSVDYETNHHHNSTRRYLDWDASPVSPFQQPKSRRPPRNFQSWRKPTAISMTLDLDREYQLKEKEADELLASIQGNYSPSSRSMTSRCCSDFDDDDDHDHFVGDNPTSPVMARFQSFTTHPNTRSNEISCNDDNDNESDDDSYDDDDLNNEMSRLQDISASLRTEMQHVQLSSLPLFQNARINPPQSGISSNSTPSPPNHWQTSSSSSSLLSRFFSFSSRFSRNDEDKMTSPQHKKQGFNVYSATRGTTTHQQQQHLSRDEQRNFHNHKNNDDGFFTEDDIRALCWSLALVWAVLLLSACHLKSKSFNNNMSTTFWDDGLDWLSFPFGV